MVPLAVGRHQPVEAASAVMVVLAQVVQLGVGLAAQRMPGPLEEVQAAVELEGLESLAAD